MSKEQHERHFLATRLIAYINEQLRIADSNAGCYSIPMPSLYWRGDMWGLNKYPIVVQEIIAYYQKQGWTDVNFVGGYTALELSFKKDHFIVQTTMVCTEAALEVKDEYFNTGDSITGIMDGWLVEIVPLKKLT